MAHLDERRARRTELAALDLAACAAWAATHGWHLVIDGYTRPWFAFEPEALPAATIDARDDDAVAVAIADPTAVLLTAGGLYVGLPAAQHPRWPWFLASSGVYGVLGLSALSGHYFGLHVHGRLRERFVGGRREEPLAVEATVGRADGTRVEIVRTTIGLSVALADEPLRCHDLAEALGHFGDRIVSIDSASHNDMELAAELERAGALPARAVVLNGRRWVRRRALTPDA